MCKFLRATTILTALLCPAFMTAQAAKFPRPFVAKAKLVNQSVPIPVTKLFTPSQDGLYRFSVYGTVTTAVAGSSDWFVNLFWTDDSGEPQSVPSLLIAQGNNLGQFVEYGFAISTNGGAVSVFEAKAGTPITYSVTQTYSDGSVYSLYYTLERLE